MAKIESYYILPIPSEGIISDIVVSQDGNTITFKLYHGMEYKYKVELPYPVRQDLIINNDYGKLAYLMLRPL